MDSYMVDISQSLEMKKIDIVEYEETIYNC